MLEKMQELIADQLSVDADSITEASSFKALYCLLFVLMPLYVLPDPLIFIDI